MTRQRRFLAAVLFTLAAVSVFAGCGRSAPEPIVARVGATPITKAALEHWISVMAPREGAPQPPRFAKCIAHLRQLAAAGRQLKQACRHEYDELRQSALQFLIASRWFIGEAAVRGIGVSGRDVDRRLGEEYGSPEGTFQFKALLAGSRTPSDVRFETRSELAAKKLRQLLTTYANDIPRAQIASYYRHNLRRYFLRERRYVELIGNLQDLSAAKDRLRQIGRGASFASSSFRLWLERPNFSSIERTHRILEQAIFQATPNVVVGPMRIGGLYFMFKVADIRPGGIQSLAVASSQIKRELGAERRVRFVERWRSKWRARTTCASAYVVQKCRQYHGPSAPEDPLDVN